MNNEWIEDIVSFYPRDKGWGLILEQNVQFKDHYVHNINVHFFHTQEESFSSNSFW